MASSQLVRTYFISSTLRYCTTRWTSSQGWWSRQILWGSIWGRSNKIERSIDLRAPSGRTRYCNHAVRAADTYRPWWGKAVRTGRIKIESGNLGVSYRDILNWARNNGKGRIAFGWKARGWQFLDFFGTVLSVLVYCFWRLGTCVYLHVSLQVSYKYPWFTQLWTADTKAMLHRLLAFWLVGWLFGKVTAEHGIPLWTPHLPNFKEHSTAWEAGSCSVDQEMSSLLWNSVFITVPCVML